MKTALIGFLLLAQTGQNILSWKDNSTNEKKFTIARKTTHCTDQSRPWWIVKGVLGNITSWVDTGLVVGHAYCYRVRAENAGVVSAWSNEAEGIAKPSCTLIKTVAPDGTVTYTCQ